MSMTKDQIRQELINHGVQVPSGNVKKEEYVKLFEEHISPMNKVTSNFSTDEEDDEQSSPIVAKADKNVRDADPANDVNTEAISKMSDAALFDFLVKAGKKPGPVISTTRNMYEKLAASVMKEDPDAKVQVKDTSTNGRHENGDDDQAANGYSDTEDDDEALETASKSSRASSKLGSVKLPTGTPTASGRSLKTSQSSSRQTVDAPRFPEKETPLIEKRFTGSELKTLRVRMDTLPSHGVYRRLPDVSSGSNISTSRDSVTGPQGLLKKPKQSSSSTYVGLAVLLIVIIVGVLFYVYYMNTDQVNEPEDELDKILESLD